MRWLERSRPETHGLFGSQDELLTAVVEVMEAPTDVPEDLDALAERLASKASDGWVVATPLVNIWPPEEAEQMGSDALFIATPDGERPDLRLMRNATLRKFGVAVDVGRRQQHGHNDELLDTRHAASLVFAETGTRRACEQRALTKAQFVVATWTLFKPPDDDGIFMPLWPMATTWFPQPSLYVEVRATTRDVQRKQTGGHTVIYPPNASSMYMPPTGEEREAPFRALLAIERRPASALLSAAWSLYLAARLPTDLHWVDRLELMIRAREALCEPPPNAADAGDAFTRWKALAARFGVSRELKRRGFDSTDEKSITDRAWKVRNIGAHSAEAALLTLGYPPTRLRHVRDAQPIPGSELAPIRIREGVEPTFAAVTFVALAAWRHMLAADFDEAAWEGVFA